MNNEELKSRIMELKKENEELKKDNKKLDNKNDELLQFIQEKKLPHCCVSKELHEKESFKWLKVSEENEELKKDNKKLSKKLKKSKSILKTMNDFCNEKFCKCDKCENYFCHECENIDIFEIMPENEKEDGTISVCCVDCIITEDNDELEKEDYIIKEDDFYLCKPCDTAFRGINMTHKIVDDDTKISNKRVDLKCKECNK